MNRNAAQQRESRRLREVAREFEGQGYRVVLHPGSADLPDFLGEFEPGLIARGPEGSVVVEVRSQNSLAGSDDLEALSRAIEGRPGWRLDLVVTNPRREGPAVEDADSLSPSEILERLDASTMLLDRGLVDLALVAAWSAAEGGMRLAAGHHGIDLEESSPSYLAKALYTFGVVDLGQFATMRDALQYRNRVVHAYRAADLSADLVRRLIEVVRSLLESR
jgi:uncharacterized protein YutE (UPF0331/DUF86 family)